MTSRPRLYISAAHKSSGKTTLAIGLCAALSEFGSIIYPFKKGPDYIDPMWLSRASGRPCYNLDFNTQTSDEIEQLFMAKSGADGLSIIEGNKGLYDGLDVEGSDSNAAMALLLDAPVVLVLDVGGITRGVAPLLLGYQSFDPRINIAGVILNKVGSPRVERKLRAVLERYTDVPVLGVVGRDESLEVRERHLGLTPPGEVGEVDNIIERLRAMVRQDVDLDKIQVIAQQTRDLEFAIPAASFSSDGDSVRIGIVRDRAFGFYYSDDLEMLESLGAKLIYFDATKDAKLPEVDGLFIGGGFPETHMAELEANKSLRADIAARAEAGLPIYAECGGLMYLTRSISWEGRRFEMVGAIDADTVMNEKPQGRGLVQLQETEHHPWAADNEKLDYAMHGGQDEDAPLIAAHEFHYAGLCNLGDEVRYAYRVKRGAGIDGLNDGIVHRNILASFTHLRNSARVSWARRFIGFVRRCKQRKGSN